MKISFIAHRRTLISFHRQLMLRINRTSDLERNVSNPEQNSPSTLPNVTLRERRHSTRTWQQRFQEMNEEDSNEDDDYHLSLTEEFDPTNNFVLFPSLSEDAKTETIEISRSNCLNELMNLYTDEQLLSKNLNVKFIGEIGIDGGGLTKELFNIFFDKCSGTFFQGEDCLLFRTCH